MFRQINCHLQGVGIRELLAVCIQIYNIWFHSKGFYTCHNSRYIARQNNELKTVNTLCLN